MSTIKLRPGDYVVATSVKSEDGQYSVELEITDVNGNTRLRYGHQRVMRVADCPQDEGVVISELGVKHKERA